MSCLKCPYMTPLPNEVHLMCCASCIREKNGNCAALLFGGGSAAELEVLVAALERLRVVVIAVDLHRVRLTTVASRDLLQGLQKNKGDYQCRGHAVMRGWVVPHPKQQGPLSVSRPCSNTEGCVCGGGSPQLTVQLG